MGRLHELAAKYGTDKLQHGYIDFYEKNLPKNPKKILEIGVLKGDSIRMWKEYFPNAEIHGLDLFEEYPIPSDIDNVTFWKGSQTDAKLLEKLRNEHFDIVIEDASHGCMDHWVTMYSLIASCKYYVIEDLHTCSEGPFFRQGLKYEQTILGAMKDNKLPFKFTIDKSEKIAVIYNGQDVTPN